MSAAEAIPSKSLHMVVERFKDAPAVYRRFRDQGRMMPEGLSYLSSWVDDKFERCYQLMETHDRRELCNADADLQLCCGTACLQTATNPQNGTVFYTYNADGSLAVKTDAKGQTLKYAYDTYGRVLTVTLAGTQGKPFWSIVPRRRVMQPSALQQVPSIQPL